MFTFTTENLLRALDVAAMPARAADESLPMLCNVQLRFTDRGLIAVSTDRYQLVRTLSEYEGQAPEDGAPAVLLHRDDIKRLLPVLKAGKKGEAALEVEEETVTVRCGGQTITLENVAGQEGAREFPRLDNLFRLHQGENTRLEADPFASVNPAYLHAITMMMKRYSERNTPVGISLDRTDPHKPVAWMMGDWAHGVLMPVRWSAPRTRQTEIDNGGGLARLFDAQDLPAEAVERAVEVETTAEPVPVGA
ncbi:hypothetical protein M3B61_09970 [Micrococcus luteus]|nr:hypothetical protein [Micrococcus luteus]MCV7583879.1 hypothetical protein [Micrococcus luteus]MCV7588319.1 hypothetical protein [Micrococcus luteus]